MFLIEKLSSKKVTSGYGNVKSITQGLFKCPVCNKEVIKDLSNGRKSESCSTKCRTRKRKHGMYGTPIYTIWAGIKGRCNSVTNPVYKYYGGLGVTYQESWEDFTNFLHDMGDSYKPGLTLKRLKDKGNYTKDNCQWVSLKEFNIDRRNKPVYKCSLDGKIICAYISVREAVLAGEAPFNSCLSRVARGERTQYKGFVWKYAE